MAWAAARVDGLKVPEQAAQVVVDRIEREPVARPEFTGRKWPWLPT